MSPDVVFRAFCVASLPNGDPGAQEAVPLGQAEKLRAAAMEPVSSGRFRAGRLALRQFAAELTDIPAAELATDYACPQCGPDGDKAHGRPGFSHNGRSVPLLLSLARTGDWILLAGLTDPAAGLRLGVDFEDPAAVGFAGFDTTALTAAEAAVVAGVPAEVRNQARARLWARKEAWLKMQGGGLRTSPASVDVLCLPGLRDLVPGETGLPQHLAAAVALG